MRPRRWGFFARARYSAALQEKFPKLKKEIVKLELKAQAIDDAKLIHTA
jgi:hypothetical protein